MESNSSADRSANLNSPLVPDTENFCLDSIKSRKSSEPPVQAANIFKFEQPPFFLDQWLVLVG